jgi:hypothetical protein
MSKQSPILGKKIKAMADGGWELAGTVTHDKSDRVVLKTDSNEILLIFKKKISAILIVSEAETSEHVHNEQKVKSQITGNDNFVLFKPAKKEDPVPQKNHQEDDLSEGGISLPHEVLLSVPDERNFRGGEDDFSISMTSLFGNNSGRISVTVDDKSK